MSVMTVARNRIATWAITYHIQQEFQYCGQRGWGESCFDPNHTGENPALIPIIQARGSTRGRRACGTEGIICIFGSITYVRGSIACTGGVEARGATVRAALKV